MFSLFMLEICLIQILLYIFVKIAMKLLLNKFLVMNIQNDIQNKTISIDIDCNLAILNNIPKNSKAYKKAYTIIESNIIDNFNGYNYQQIDINIEFSQIMELYNKL